MKSPALAVAVFVLGLVALGGSRAASNDELSTFSGPWSGTKRVEVAGSCRRSGDPETSATLELKVQRDGRASARDSAGRNLEGTVSTDLTVNLVLKGKSRCPVDGEVVEREWTADYGGQITAGESGYLLTLEGTEEPCPPHCRFKVRYSVRKN